MIEDLDSNKHVEKYELKLVNQTIEKLPLSLYFKCILPFSHEWIGSLQLRTVLPALLIETVIDGMLYVQLWIVLVEDHASKTKNKI